MLITSSRHGALRLAIFTVHCIVTQANVKPTEATDCLVNSQRCHPTSRMGRGRSLLQGKHRAGAAVTLRSGAARLAEAFRKQFGLGLGPELSVTRSSTRAMDVPFPFGEAAALAQRHLLQMADHMFSTDIGKEHGRRHTGRGHTSKGELLRRYAEQTPPVMLLLPSDAYSFAPQDEQALLPELVIESDSMRPLSGESVAGSEFGSPFLSISASGDGGLLEPILTMADKPLSHQVAMTSFPLPEDPAEEVSEAAAHMAGELQGLEDRLGADGVDAVIDQMYRDLKRKYKHQDTNTEDNAGKSNVTAATAPEVNETEAGETGVILIAHDGVNVNQTADDQHADSLKADSPDNETVLSQNISSQANNVSITITSADSTKTVGNLSKLNVSAIFNKGLKEMREVLENSLENTSDIPNIEFPDDFGNAWPEGGFESSASASSSQVTSTQTVVKDGKVITTTKHCENGKCTETTKTVDAASVQPSSMLAGQQKKAHSLVY